MAKWGEGDPRWLVEHRSDGKNVNGWHWEEKNKLEWSKQRLAELLVGLTRDVNGGDRSVKVSALKDVVGDACVTTRKGNKKFAVFDLKLTLSWTMSPLEDGTEIKGEVKIDDFASTGDPDDYVYTVTAEGTGTAQDVGKTTVLQMRSTINDKLHAFAEELGEQ